VKAVQRRRYGSPEVLELVDADTPVPGPGEVLVRVRAASVNPLDWHELTGAPYLVRLENGLLRPKSPALGVDFAGRVVAVGEEVSRFRAGDDVFGMRSGAFAEYVCVREAGVIVKKPDNLTYEQAAAVPIAALTALQGLRKGGVGPGRRVLINGAAGGVGTFAVQLAAFYGALVTGVCSAGNVDLVRGLGADRVLDYAHEDYAETGPYDLILDNVGNRPLRDRRRALAPLGSLIMISGPKKNRWIGPLADVATMLVVARFTGRHMQAMLAKPDAGDLTRLQELLAAGSITPAIDRTYPLPDLAAALAYLGGGHARAKVVVTL
jgi:NADPH:quinone reductase-like Zn-dependent oxidoreductase